MGTTGLAFLLVTETFRYNAWNDAHPFILKAMAAVVGVTGIFQATMRICAWRDFVNRAPDRYYLP
jgi:hypothetical protein